MTECNLHSLLLKQIPVYNMYKYMCRGYCFQIHVVMQNPIVKKTAAFIFLSWFQNKDIALFPSKPL